MVEQVIELKKQQIRSLKELRRNRRFLSRDYYVQQIDSHNYVLGSSKTLKVVKMDTLERINSYLRLRNLFDRTVFDFGMKLKVKYGKD